MADAQDIAAFIASWLSEQLDQDVQASAEFAALGLDSLDVVRLTDALSERYHLDELPVSLVLDHPSIAALAAHLAALPQPA